MIEKQMLIIEEAVKLFAEKGYHATSVQEIVEKCEMAKGSFYNDSKSKEELLISVFKYYHELILVSVRAIEENPYMNSKGKFLKQLDVKKNGKRPLETVRDAIKRFDKKYLNQSRVSLF